MFTNAIYSITLMLISKHPHFNALQNFLNSKYFFDLI